MLLEKFERVAAAVGRMSGVEAQPEQLAPTVLAISSAISDGVSTCGSAVVMEYRSQTRFAQHRARNPFRAFSDGPPLGGRQAVGSSDPAGLRRAQRIRNRRVRQNDFRTAAASVANSRAVLSANASPAS